MSLADLDLSEPLVASLSKPGRIARAALAAALLGGLAGSALAESADCAKLHQQIDLVSQRDNNAQYQVAAEKQRGEIDRMVAYSRSIGCENHKFLIFGSDPPAQCGGITAQIEKMRSNLDDLQSRAGGGEGGRGELVARYRSECVNGGDNGGAALNPDAPASETVVQEGGVQAGSKAVCVKSCDGSFFPVSYSASAGRMASLEDLCHAQCPNADVTLFSYPAAGDIEQAISSAGVRYVDSPNALKYRTSFDPNCSCRRKGQSWVEALAGAEQHLGREDKSDIFVTAAKSDEMARPKLDPKAKPPLKPAAGTDAEGVDTALSQQTQTVSRETSGIATNAPQAGAVVGAGQGQWIEVVGPDGVKRRVRIIDPTL